MFPFACSLLPAWRVDLKNSIWWCSSTIPLWSQAWIFVRKKEPIRDEIWVFVEMCDSHRILWIDSKRGENWVRELKTSIYFAWNYERRQLRQSDNLITSPTNVPPVLLFPEQVRAMIRLAHISMNSMVWCEPACRLLKLSESVGAFWRFPRQFAERNSICVFWVVFWSRKAFEVQQITLVIHLVQLKSDLVLQ